jgi:uroporphyrinogen decarboxylase
MNSRERVFATLQRQAADRIPIDFWATDAVYGSIEQNFGLTREAFLDRYDVDFRYIEGPRYTGPPLPADTDIWGVRRSTVSAAKGETYSEVSEAPLVRARSRGDVDGYPLWPSPDWFDYGGIEAQCDAILRQNRVVVFMGDRLNRVAQLKPAMYIRGTEEIFTDMALREEIADAVFHHLRRFYVEYLSRILQASAGKIDIVLTGDDFGAQHGLLLSTDMWRRFVRPGFTDYLSCIRDHGALSMHHTCGSVVELIPDFIECGLDVLQSLQPEAAGMEFGNLYDRFGSSMSFQGGISIQRTLPFGTPEDIRDEVARIAGSGGHDGGHIFCTSHNIQADTPIDNVTALMNAYHDLGRQPPEDRQ